MNLQEKMNGKNIDYLIGSGASYPIVKTLDLGENKPSFEEIVSSYFDFVNFLIKTLSTQKRLYTIVVL